MILQFLDLENSIFKPEDKTYTPFETKELNFKVKKQIEKTAASESLATGTEIGNAALLWCLLTSIMLNTVLADGGMVYIVQMVRTL